MRLQVTLPFRLERAPIYPACIPDNVNVVDGLTVLQQLAVALGHERAIWLVAGEPLDTVAVEDRREVGGRHLIIDCGARLAALVVFGRVMLWEGEGW